MDFDIQIVGRIDHPVKSFRLYAIEKLIENGVSEKDFSNIQKRLEVEDDPECRSLLEHAEFPFSKATQPSIAQPNSIPKSFLPNSRNFRLKRN